MAWKIEKIDESILFGGACEVAMYCVTEKGRVSYIVESVDAKKGTERFVSTDLSKAEKQFLKCVDDLVIKHKIGL